MVDQGRLQPGKYLAGEQTSVVFRIVLPYRPGIGAILVDIHQRALVGTPADETRTAF